MSASVTADAEDTLLRSEATTEIVGYRLRRAQLSVFQRFIAAFEQLNLRPAEYSVLALIADNPGRKQTEIAEILGIKRANFVALINGLDSRGLTERRVARGDRRANALYLTEEGERFLERARAVQAEFEADCVERLGGAEARDTFVRMLDRLC
ncbi:MarR family winged helix-turn-helix transcriptional regulator [Pelagibacterium sp. 26DY04]|uniref:MarR family winged helix-turn-helix transcriptional regulator n=1 Tax=Pelagibacterium sp. 26DY04 TaxID=2967130 RepID=UPI0028159AFC|nr:MarR family winged helix-turn-helix transcriptional regulator [Pelagibacterium sp. 26DY04]WMT87536.1 MarR family winged helix-turn-helix transcriptional regulator [Pelagibacterium sp. 26DY04]